MGVVSIVKCSTYNSEVVREALKKSLEPLGGIKKFVKLGSKVLLKPNMLSAKSPEDAITTHPVIVEEVIRLVQSAGAKAFIGDSPAMDSQQKGYQKTGFEKVAQDTKSELVFFKGKNTAVPNAILCKSFYLYEDLPKYDLIINLPKIKTHMLTDYTGAVKNLFGLVVGKNKGGFHLRYSDKKAFTQMLLDLYYHVMPGLTIMDGVVGMEGEGPFAGEPRKIGLLLASNNALSLDLAVTKIINMENTPLNQIVKERKLVDSVDIVGEDLNKLVISDFARPKGYMKESSGIISSLFNRFFLIYPFVDKDKCTGCRMCFNICPSKPKTISMIRGGRKFIPSFDYKNCIRCYCCHEVCPEKCIVLKRKLL
ncbi:DUF362 domain-containing protein [Candidatus Woesearchaeota archaeon]|nr:DUF362 domain-containing protein [Candidatus Woesearchaeota archaeon]